MWLARFRLYAVNAFIAIVVSILLIDTMPQAPAALSSAIYPLAVRLGIYQGPWNLFSPRPDFTNTRVRAEITYRDGVRKEWIGPDWRTETAWQKWVGHRRREWMDHIVLQWSAPAWKPWCRYLARAERPDLLHADQGAEVRVIHRDAPIPSAEIRPWPSIREATKFD